MQCVCSVYIYCIWGHAAVSSHRDKGTCFCTSLYGWPGKSETRILYLTCKQPLCELETEERVKLKATGPSLLSPLWCPSFSLTSIQHLVWLYLRQGRFVCICASRKSLHRICIEKQDCWFTLPWATHTHTHTHTYKELLTKISQYLLTVTVSKYSECTVSVSCLRLCF